MTMTYQPSTMENRRTPNDPQAYPAGSSSAPAQYQATGISHTEANLGNVMTQFQALSLPGAPINQASVGIPGMAPTGTYMLAGDGLVIGPISHPAGAFGIGHMGDNGYGHPNGPYLTGQFNPYVQYPVMPYPHRGSGASHYQRGAEVVHHDVPALENRRGSYSTNESTPTTPFFTGGASHRDHGPRVAATERSSYTTPSPQGNPIASGLVSEPVVKSTALSAALDRNLEELLIASPAIPKAVPAVFTPAAQMKSLEQSLENRIPGNRNVYIRGLHPTTDDELLLRFAQRFGRVETSKAIIDTSTGACKGFGFAKFVEVRDSEMCIRGFHRLGYEVGFARESFNSRLKAEGDDSSANLYISNLPKNLTEMELGAIFHGFDILSSKILRDSMGNSRGVGFARFESRDICDDIIRKYNGVSIGEEGLLMNIRYADTPGQKELKRITAERRQFRTNEYNIGAYGTPLVGMQPQLYTAPSIRRSYGGSASVQTITPLRELDQFRHISEAREGGSAGHSQSSADVSIATPSSDDSDEGVTIQVDSTVANGSTQSSPTVKKEHK